MFAINSKLLAVALLLCLLSACAPKPPGCADPQVVETAKEMLVAGAIKGLEQELKDDPDHLVHGVLNGTTVEFVQVLNEGYSADQRKQSCRANLRVQTPTGKSLEKQVKYTVQVTEDRQGQYYLEVEGGQTYVLALMVAAQEYYRNARWSGDWKGEYACDGIRDAANGPQGPFSMPVTLAVKGDFGTMARQTRGGGTEKLKGYIRPSFDGRPGLNGEGSNSPDDTWTVSFEPKVEGKRLTATGLIRVLESTGWRALRRCTLDLQQEPVVVPQGKAASSAR